MDEQTINTYNLQALEYDAETAYFWDLFPVTIFNEFQHLAPGKKVLDIGCGPGRDGEILANKGFDVTCLDASETMLDICNNKGLQTIHGDFLDLPFNDHVFDSVWAYTSLLHIPKSKFKLALSEASRVLKNNGAFGLGLIQGDGEGYKASKNVSSPRWFSYFDESEVREYLAKAGFEVKYFETFQPRNSTYLHFLCKKAIYR
jgi:ubiquinone/menaquinone biosynthesis C-methylase UbiE